MSSTDSVIVRRRWDAPDSAAIPVEAVRGVHFRQDTGGVCGALPREFLTARVWCDHLPDGALGHHCREGPPPHELTVCVLRSDNRSQVYEKLRAQVGR